MGMFEGRFKFRRHHDFRMDAGPIKSTYRPRNPQEFDGNYIVAENLENQDYSKYLRSIAEEHCFEDFLLTVMPEEDYQELKDGTLSDDKKEDYNRRYSEEYKEYFEKYFKVYLKVYFDKSLRIIAKEHCFKDFLLTVIPEEDCQELKDGTLSNDKKEDYYRRYSEEYKEYLEKYFKVYLKVYCDDYLGEARYYFFEDFLLTVMPEEDCQELKNGTLSDDKKEDYYRRYSEEYKKYFEEYFEEYLVEYKAEYSIQVTASKPTKWKLGGSCFSDKHFDFKSVANTQEVLWGVLFSICAFIPIFLFSLISWWGDLLLLIFAIIILIGYSSLLVRHLNYRGWSKVKGLALPVISAVVCLVILGTGVSETLNHGGDSFDNLIESILLPTILQDIVLMIYLLLLACIKNKQGETTNLKA